MLNDKDITQGDQDLLLRLKADDSAAFDLIYERYWGLTYAAAFKRIPDKDTVSDIVQDIFLQLWMRRAELVIDNLAGYLYVAVRNRVLKSLSMSDRFVPVPDLMDQLLQADEQADADIIRKEFIVHYESLVVKLSKAQQEIFKLRFDEDLSTIQIAERLNIKRKTVQNQLGKSVAQIRNILGLLTFLFLMK